VALEVVVAEVVAGEVAVEAVVVAFLGLDVVIEEEKVEVFLIGFQVIRILQVQLIQL
jgi:hypothetical protein